MSIIKSTPLKTPRKFRVKPGYVVILGTVTCEPGAEVIAATEETLQALMNQRWKIQEETLIPVETPKVVLPPVSTPSVEAPPHDKEKQVQAEIPQEQAQARPRIKRPR